MTDTAANNNSENAGNRGDEGHENDFESTENASDLDNESFDEGEVPKNASFQDAQSSKLEKEALEWKQRAAYLAAEIDNMKKRFARDKMDIIRSASEDLLQKILPVVDNSERAVKATKEAEATLEKTIREHPVFSNLLKGIDMTLKHFDQTLEQAGVQILKSLGQDFDPTRHEAIGQLENKEHGDNKVIGEVSRGYTLNGRVIRPAQVVVNKLKN